MKKPRRPVGGGRRGAGRVTAAAWSEFGVEGSRVCRCGDGVTSSVTRRESAASVIGELLCCLGAALRPVCSVRSALRGVTARRAPAHSCFISFLRRPVPTANFYPNPDSGIAGSDQLPAWLLRSGASEAVINCRRRSGLVCSRKFSVDLRVAFCVEGAELGEESTGGGSKISAAIKPVNIFGDCPGGL